MLPVFLIWLPLFLSMLNVQNALWDNYHNRAARNSKLIKYFIGTDNPKFVYINDGIHTTYESYPTRQVFKDATNEQLIEVNKILPEPIKYLFLRPTDWLFANNKELILMGGSIVNDQYKYLGFSKDDQIVVYKLNQG